MTLSPTLTLEIPFVLLGRRDARILDPPLLPPHEQATQPIKLILQALQLLCPTIPIDPWALDTFEWQKTDPAKLTTSQKRTYLSTLTSTQKAEEARWRTPSTGWILRPAPRSSVFLSSAGLHDWHDGDACLTSAEAAGLGKTVWQCPVLLQRFGVPIATASSRWSDFVREAQELFGGLKTFMGFEGPVSGVDGHVRYWDLVVGERCFLKTTVGVVDAEAGKRVLMLNAAFERELDMLRATREVIGFVGVGGWLEWMLLRKLAKEKRDAWRALGCSQEDEQECNSSTSAADERYRRTKGREREWWDVMHDLSENEIVAGMHSFEHDGKTRLSVSLQQSADAGHHVTIQGHRSTLDAADLVAYIELLARVADTAQNHITERLAEALESFHLYQPPTPTARFSNMLHFLSQHGPRVSDASTRTLTASLDAFNPTADSRHGEIALPPAARPKRPREAVDPFYHVRTYLEAKHAAEKKDMVIFMERYDRAGGYKPTTDEKLRAMVQADEDR